MSKVPPPPPTFDVADEPGFRTLFDGSESRDRIFRKWRMVGQGAFELTRRCLIAQPGTEIGLLYYTLEQFDNFVLKLDFLLPSPYGESNDNSGVHVRFRDPQKPMLPGTHRTEFSDNQANVAVDTGYEIQIDEEARGDARRNEEDGHFYNRTGAIYKIKSFGEMAGQQAYHNDQTLAASMWHSYEIRVHERTYEVLLNRRRVTRFVADKKAPGEIYRGRKRSEDGDSGFIGLQSHTGQVAFANIRIRIT